MLKFVTYFAFLFSSEYRKTVGIHPVSLDEYISFVFAETLFSRLAIQSASRLQKDR
jgi:hypothetical protein